MSTSDPKQLTEGQALTVYDVDEDRVLLMSHATADGPDDGNKYEIPLNVPDFDQTLIESFIDGLYITNAIHVRRGYRIKDTTPEVIAIHIMEECVELVEATLVSKDPDSIKEEAGDVLSLYLHLLRKCGISSQDVIRGALGKLSRYWTTDPEKVNTEEAGFGRQNRGAPPEIEHGRSTENWSPRN